MKSCGDSCFDRELCFCVDSGIMHQYTCQQEPNHKSPHEGRDLDYPSCDPAQWTDNHGPWVWDETNFVQVTTKKGKENL